jgi:hypothetical protein
MDRNIDLEKALNTYILKKHNQDRTTGFIDGFKQGQTQQLTLQGVGSSSFGMITITNTSVLLLPRKSWQIYKKGWNKHQDIYGKKWWIKYAYK